MPAGVSLTVVGLLIVGYAGWYVPRALGRARARSHARGGDWARIDDLLASRRWRNISALALAAGAAMVVLGVLFIALGE